MSPTVRLSVVACVIQLLMAASAKSLNSLLKELEGLLKEHSLVMDALTERVVDKAIKYGAVFTEVRSPKWKPVRD